MGIKNGALTTSYVDGWDVRQALGLLSPGFTIAMRRTGGPAAQPLVGDWDGDGKDQLGWFRAGQVALQMTGPGGGWIKRFRYGAAGDVAVVGDWDGDGDDDLGVYRAGTWLLRTGLTGGAPTKTVRLRPARRPARRRVVDRQAARARLVRGRTWLLRRSLTSGVAQRRFGFGRVGDVPVVGSWNGSARTGIGVERDGQWLLRNRRSAGPAGMVVTFGQAADRAGRRGLGRRRHGHPGRRPRAVVRAAGRAGRRRRHPSPSPSAAEPGLRWPGRPGAGALRGGISRRRLRGRCPGKHARDRPPEKE